MGVDAVVLLTVDELLIQFIRISRTVMAALCVFLLITVSIQTGEHSLNLEIRRQVDTYANRKERFEHDDLIH